MTNSQKAAIEEAAKQHAYRCEPDNVNPPKWADHYFSFKNGMQEVIEHPERYGLADIDIYKECLEQFIPEDKWYEATSFLSSHGNGVAKVFQRKENYG